MGAYTALQEYTKVNFGVGAIPCLAGSHPEPHFFVFLLQRRPTTLNNLLTQLIQLDREQLKPTLTFEAGMLTSTADCFTDLGAFVVKFYHINNFFDKNVLFEFFRPSLQRLEDRKLTWKKSGDVCLNYKLR